MEPRTVTRVSIPTPLQEIGRSDYLLPFTLHHAHNYPIYHRSYHYCADTYCSTAMGMSPAGVECAAVSSGRALREVSYV